MCRLEVPQCNHRIIHETDQSKKHDRTDNTDATAIIGTDETVNIYWKTLDIQLLIYTTV